MRGLRKESFQKRASKRELLKESSLKKNIEKALKNSF
jgi:hypothetical protein